MEELLTDPKTVWGGIALIGSVSAAWGVARTRIGNTERYVKSVSENLNRHVADDHDFQIDTVTRLSSIEAEVKRLESIENKLDRALRGQRE